MEFKKESIFVSVVRHFFTCFAAILGLLIGISVFIMGFMFLSGPDVFPDKCSVLVAPDANGKRDLLPHTAPVVLKLDIHGVIGQGDLVLEKVQSLLLDSREGMLADNRVKAILLDIDSPGGTATDSEGIYHALLDYKAKYNVPIYAYIGGMCASGAMYIACAADKICANESSTIGSVGVILGPLFNFSGLMDRYGVQSLTMTEGKDKDMLNPFRPWVPGEDASIRAINLDLYEAFVNAVVTARPHMNKTKLVEEYGAQIFIAHQAEQYGYVDESNSDYAMTLTELVKAADLKDPNFYQVFQLQVPRPFLSDLANNKFSLLTGKLTHVFQISPYMNSELSGKFLYLYQPPGQSF
jgi:protease-4